MDDATQLNNDHVGYTVLDAAGGPLGLLTALYADYETGVTVFGAVTMIRRGRRRAVFVPLDSVKLNDATHTVTLRCGRELARRAPAVQAGRHLASSDEPGLYDYYDVPYTALTAHASRLVLIAGQRRL